MFISVLHECKVSKRSTLVATEQTAGPFSEFPSQEQSPSLSRPSVSAFTSSRVTHLFLFELEARAGGLPLCSEPPWPPSAAATLHGLGHIPAGRGPCLLSGAHASGGCHTGSSPCGILLGCFSFLTTQRLASKGQEEAARFLSPGPRKHPPSLRTFLPTGGHTACPDSREGVDCFYSINQFRNVIHLRCTLDAFQKILF